MDKKKIGFFIILLAMVVLAGGLLWSVFHKKETPAPPKEEASMSPKERKEFEEETDKHATYVQDESQDPFKNAPKSEGDVKVGDDSFSYRYINNGTYKNAGATLIDASSNYFIFRTLNDVLSMYNAEADKKNVLDEAINQAVITSDNQYIIYSKNLVFQEAFYAFDTSSLETISLGQYEHPSRMSAVDIKYMNGLVYYLVRETETGKTFVKFVGVPTKENTYSGADRDAKVNISTDKLFSNKDTVFAYNKATKNVEVILPNNSGKTLISLKNEKIKDIKTIQYIDDKYWAVSFIDDKNNFVLLTPKGKVTEFTGLMAAYWIDEHSLIVNDNLTLYTYNIDTKKKHVLKTDIAELNYQTKFLSVITRDGDFIVLTKKR